MRTRILPLAIALACASCATIPFEENINTESPWRMTVETLPLSGKVKVIKAEDQAAPKVTKKNGTVTVLYENVGEMDIDLSISYSAVPDDKKAAQMVCTVANNEEGWFVSRVESPAFEGFNFDEGTFLYKSAGNGKRYSIDLFEEKSAAAPGKDCGGWTWNKKEKRYDMPIDGKMKWGTVSDGQNSLYVACQFNEWRLCTPFVSYNPETGAYSFFSGNQFACHPGESITTAPLVLRKLEGDWHAPAEYYHDWFLANHTIAAHPQWLRESSGWMLTILKQQNGEVIWPYSTIPNEMFDTADKLGLDILGLFGRAVGGHDRYYPNYTPDPEMGGEQGLKDAIAELHKKGKRCILYVNGQLLDHDSQGYWEREGESIGIVNKAGKVYGEFFQKFYDGPNREFGWACLANQKWQDMLMQFALDANELGADGILYDQLGGMNTRRCYSSTHGHKAPDYIYDDELVGGMEKIYKKMHEINPDFVIVTEGYTDVMMGSMAFTHRGAAGKVYRFSQKVLEDMCEGEKIAVEFPQLLPYTFPEKINTSNNPAPVNMRSSLNFNAVFAERDEIEVRYKPDVDYVVNDKLQDIKSYSNIKGPSSGSGPYHEKMVTTEDPVAARIYTKQIHEFERAHKDLFWLGKFVDNKGFTLETEAPFVYATSYISEDGNRLGVVVWNIDINGSAAYTVVPDSGWKFKEVCAPDCEPALGDSIAPNSIHFVIFEK